MRLVLTLNNQKQAHEISSLLTSQNIENQLEVYVESDWGSSNYGDLICRLWIINEEGVEPSLTLIKEYQENPEQESLKQQIRASRSQPFVSPPEIKPPLNQAPPMQIKEKPLILQKFGTLTAYLLGICISLFFISEFTTPKFQPYPSFISPIPLFSPPLKKVLYYDYPSAFEIVDRVVKLYGIDRVLTLEDLPKEATHLLQVYKHTPYWKGIYQSLLDKFQDPSLSLFDSNVPLFEKIREGEIWRLFSPCLLHSDILHLLFNMLWLVVLGRQLEQRIGFGRYLFFILLTGVASNTAQYLVSGSNFIGLSGVLCGMLTFIWMRQRMAAWEAYQLDKSTMTFMALFIFSMFGLQLISFTLELSGNQGIASGIANTAHISGGCVGLLLGKLSFFESKI